MNLKTKVALNPKQFEGVSGFRTEVIEKTIIDRTIEKDRVVENQSTERIFQDEELFLCQEDYESTTRESVAKAIAQEMEHSNRFYKTVTSKDIPAVEVLVHPQNSLDIYQRVEESLARLLKASDREVEEPVHVTLDEVYNAYWTLENSDNDEAKPIIAFLPHFTPESSVGVESKPLWTIPFVGRHEYGHHVFSQHMKNIMGLEG